MATKLRKLKIDRVDFVARGANQEAHVLLFKRDDEHVDEVDESPLEEIPDKKEGQEEITGGDVDLTNPTDESLEKEDVDMADKPNEELDALKAEVESLKSVNETLTKELGDAKADIAKRDEKGVEEDIWKGVSPALKRMFEDQKRETEIAKAAAQVERDERIRRDCIAKAEGYEFLPVNPNGDWEVFKAIDNLDESISGRIYELLRAGDVNLKKAGLPNERGSKGGDNDGVSPFEEIERMVSEKMNKSANAMTYDMALSQVIRENPALYKSYVNQSKVHVGKGE